MWVEPFCSCVRCPSTTSTISSLTDRQSSFHNPNPPSLTAPTPFHIHQVRQKTSFRCCLFLETYSRSAKTQTPTSLCLMPSLSEIVLIHQRKKTIFFHTHAVSGFLSVSHALFHMCRVCVWDVWLYDPLSQACPKLSLPAYCVLFTVSFHLNWPLQILNSLQASQSHPSYLAFASLFFCWWFKCVGFPVPRHCPGEECSWT